MSDTSLHLINAIAIKKKKYKKKNVRKAEKRNQKKYVEEDEINK